jgi:hypothetical protein
MLDGKITEAEYRVLKNRRLQQMEDELRTSGVGQDEPL